MKIEAVKVRRLYLEVASQIETLIVGGDLNVGDRLPSERDLAAQFGVSRPTIREAMIALEIAGFVEIRTGSGIYVLQNRVSGSPGLKDIGPGSFEILEARKLVEPEAAARAAESITDEQLLDLQQALEDMQGEDDQGSVSEQADKRFHCIIGEASGNSAISAMLTWLWDMRIDSELSTLFHQRVREMGVHPSLDEHRAIFQALKDRDSEAARKAMLAHINLSIEGSKSYLEA